MAFELDRAEPLSAVEFLSGRDSDLERAMEHDGTRILHARLTAAVEVPA